VSRISAENLPTNAALPAYDRAEKSVGIVHFGLGAFTRAHQAWYTDRAMELHGGDWMIAGISLRSPTVGEQLNPQDGLYTLAEKSGEGTKLRVIGSVAEVIVAPKIRAHCPASAAPSTHIVTFTVTEKGYCRNAAAGSISIWRRAGSIPCWPMLLPRKAAGSAD
jgi:fructuronate reductase